MSSLLHALGRARLICGSQSTPAVAATIYERLGSSAEFVHVATQWESEFITLRAGGLIPIARYIPRRQGARGMIAVRSSASVVLPVKAVTVCRKVHDADGRAVAMLLEARMARHGYDLQLTCHASEAWRATFFRSSGTAGKDRFRRVEPAPKPGPACN